MAERFERSGQPGETAAATLWIRIALSPQSESQRQIATCTPPTVAQEGLAQERRWCLMKSEPVSLPVIAGVSLDCSFWPEDDGWSGVCDRLMVIVRGSSFEDAKKHMETALQEHIERILREQLGRSVQRVS